MKALSLKNGLIAAALIGGAAVIYVVFSALVSSEKGPMDSFAVGAMSGFRTVSDPPDQPLTALLTGEGDEITLADKRGKVVLVNFWATWCAPCVVEMPYLNELQARYGSDEFEVVAVSMDRSIEDARAFYREHGLTSLGLYHDQSFRAAMAAGARGLPLTVLYDPHGGEIGRLDGEAEWASEEAFALIEAAIERY
ncbi:MAG: TlpA disulfide reductase family protein [Oceanicaulis sp.]